MVIKSGWPSGLRRQTQGTSPYSLVESTHGNSGPLMRAGVQIPFLTKHFYPEINLILFSKSKTELCVHIIH